MEETVCNNLNKDMKSICYDHEECKLLDNFTCTKKPRINAGTGAEVEALCNSLNADMRSTCEDNEACALEWTYRKTHFDRCVRKPFYKKPESKTLKRKIESSRRIEKLIFMQKNTIVTVSALKDGSYIECLNKRLKLQAIYPYYWREEDQKETSLDENFKIDIDFITYNHTQNCIEYIYNLTAFSINDPSTSIGSHEIKYLLSVDSPKLDNDGNLMFDISKTEFKHCHKYVIIRLECGENIYDNPGLQISTENMRNIKESRGCRASAYLNNVDMKKVEKYFFKREWSQCFYSSGELCTDLIDQVNAQAMYAGIPTAVFIVLVNIIGYFC